MRTAKTQLSFCGSRSTCRIKCVWPASSPRAPVAWGRLSVSGPLRWRAALTEELTPPIEPMVKDMTRLEPTLWSKFTSRHNPVWQHRSSVSSSFRFLWATRITTAPRPTALTRQLWPSTFASSPLFVVGLVHCAWNWWAATLTVNTFKKYTSQKEQKCYVWCYNTVKV